MKEHQRQWVKCVSCKTFQVYQNPFMTYYKSRGYNETRKGAIVNGKTPVKKETAQQLPSGTPIQWMPKK